MILRKARRYLVLVALLAGAAPSAAQWLSYPPSPVGALRIARPTIRWQVWRADDTPIRGVTMSVNGAPVPAVYHAEQRALVYDPPQPLSPGSYEIVCRVVAKGTPPISRTWRFAIAPDAVLALPPPNTLQRTAHQVANRLRERLALPPFRLDARLCAAAAAHSRYLARNRRTGHIEWPGTPGFVGVLPAYRRAVFGYAGNGYEDVSYGNRSVAAAVTALFDAPYHRIPFLQPGVVDLGAGRVGRHTTLEFGASEAEGVVVYPVEGQRNVPVAWDGKETPNPLRLHSRAGSGHRPVRGPVGYVITFVRFSADRSPIRVADATLTTAAGKPVPCYRNTPENDRQLRYAALLIPKRPLQPHTTYRASVTAYGAHGEVLSRTWSFTTGGPTPPAGSRRATRG